MKKVLKRIFWFLIIVIIIAFIIGAYIYGYQNCAKKKDVTIAELQASVQSLQKTIQEISDKSSSKKLKSAPVPMN